MGLEKFDDAIAEYLETKRKHTRDALKLADLSDSDIEKYCADIEKEILGFVKCNEPYAQLLMDLEHIFSKTFNLYSLTEIAKKKNPDNPSYVIQSWLRDINTLQFLYLWEKDNNQYFIEEAAKELIEKTKQPSFTMTAKLWIKNTRATGIRSKQGHGGGTLARQEIAIDFITWTFPEKRYELSKLIVTKPIEKLIYVANLLAILFDEICCSYHNLTGFDFKFGDLDIFADFKTNYAQITGLRKESQE